MEEVEEVLEELKNKHAGTYTEDKLRACPPHPNEEA